MDDVRNNTSLWITIILSVFTLILARTSSIANFEENIRSILKYLYIFTICSFRLGEEVFLKVNYDRKRVKQPLIFVGFAWNWPKTMTNRNAKKIVLFSNISSLSAAASCRLVLCSPFSLVSEAKVVARREPPCRLRSSAELLRSTFEYPSIQCSPIVLTNISFIFTAIFNGNKRFLVMFLFCEFSSVFF